MKKYCILIFLFYTTKIYLAAQNTPAPIPLVDIILSPNHADWNYTIGDEAKIEFLVLKYGVPLPNISIDYEIGPEMMPPENKGKMVLPEGKGEIIIGTMKTPGFKQLSVKTEFDGKVYRDQIKLAFSPEKITPTVSCPGDFVSFWDSLKTDLAKLPLDVKIKPLPEQSTTKANLFLVSFQNDKKGKRIYGYLAKPRAEGKYPVLLCPPGAGIKPIGPNISYAEQGFITLSIEIHGISPEVDAGEYKNISNAFGDYWQLKLDDRDNYYYKSVYLACTRAIDLLCSQAEFDGKNVAVTGGSQGGALTIVTAALDQRVTCLAAFYPALCDLTGYINGRAGGWPHIFSEKQARINVTPQKVATAAYYDVVNFARQIKVPGFYSFGYNDNTCPPTSVFSAINVVTAPKIVEITPISGHWRFEETNQKSIQWIKEQLK